MVIRIQDLYTFHVVARTGAMQDAALELASPPAQLASEYVPSKNAMDYGCSPAAKTGIALTVAGRALQSDVGAAFSGDRVRERQAFYICWGHYSDQFLRDICTFHACFQFGRFAMQHPEIKVSVETEDRLVDLKSEPVDLAIPPRTQR